MIVRTKFAIYFYTKNYFRTTESPKFGEKVAEIWENAQIPYLLNKWLYAVGWPLKMIVRTKFAIYFHIKNYFRTTESPKFGKKVAKIWENAQIPYLLNKWSYAVGWPLILPRNIYIML